MSLITRCPACETMFRVVPDQLRISGGWVRCGTCNEAFDASAHLVELPTLAQQEAVSSEALEPTPPEVIEPAPEPTPTPTPEVSVVLPVAVPQEPVSFMDEAAATAPSRWHRPWVRAGLTLAAVLLCFGLLVQVWLQERDRLLAQVPGARLVLRYICQPLGCAVWLPRQIDAILIDGASFNKVDDTVFQLNFALRNTAMVDLALPAFELTLTDSQDQPFMRRIFRANEFELGNRLLRAGAELNGKAMLAIDFPAAAAPLAGYRLVAFYP